MHINMNITRRAFTLFELMVTITISVVLASMVLPMLKNDDHLKLIAASAIIRSDIEFAQSLSIKAPTRPVLVRFDGAANGYFLSYADDADTPITRDDTGEPYSVILGYGRATAAEGVTLTVADMNKYRLYFESNGGLLEFNTNPVITLQSGDEWFQLAVEPSTGSIVESSGTGTPP